jgi:hypothetical protein
MTVSYSLTSHKKNCKIFTKRTKTNEKEGTIQEQQNLKKNYFLVPKKNNHTTNLISA